MGSIGLNQGGNSNELQSDDEGSLFQRKKYIKKALQSYRNSVIYTFSVHRNEGH